MSRYAAGASAERDLIKLLTTRGWRCIRTAGSHGEADVAAARSGVRFLIQVKRSHLSENQCKDLIIDLSDVAMAWEGYPLVAFRESRGRWEFYPKYKELGELS